jgi:hypothetical protein
MSEIVTRVLENMANRTTGPLHFRMILQPAMACIFATLDGLRDAKTGKPPYFWSLLSNPSHRVEMIRDGWKSVGKVFVFALALDAAYQFKVQHFVYPGELVIVAFILAILPYLFLRGVVTRLMRGRTRRIGE